MIRKIAVLAVIPLTVGLAACSTHHHASGLMHSAVASATANPSVQADLKLAQKQVRACVTKIGMTHLAMHPFKGITQVEQCAAPKGKLTAVKACAAKAIAANGIKAHVLAKDELAIARCAVTAK